MKTTDKTQAVAKQLRFYEKAIENVRAGERGKIPAQRKCLICEAFQDSDANPDPFLDGCHTCPLAWHDEPFVKSPCQTTTFIDQESMNVSSLAELRARLFWLRKQFSKFESQEFPNGIPWEAEEI